MKDLQEIVKHLESLSNVTNIEGKARFGIISKTVLGIPMPEIKSIAKKIGVNHDLAKQLWETEIHEARHLAIFIADKKKVDRTLMEKWVLDFNSWDICDNACSTLFSKHKDGFQITKEWAERQEEYVKRAGFAMMAYLALKSHKEPDEDYQLFFELIIKHSTDERKYVMKAVNWALRQLGKRSEGLLLNAIDTCGMLTQNFVNSKSAKWIASDALREFKTKYPVYFKAHI